MNFLKIAGLLLVVFVTVGCAEKFTEEDQELPEFQATFKVNQELPAYISNVCVQVTGDNGYDSASCASNAGLPIDQGVTIDVKPGYKAIVSVVDDRTVEDVLYYAEPILVTEETEYLVSGFSFSNLEKPKTLTFHVGNKPTNQMNKVSRKAVSYEDVLANAYETCPRMYGENLYYDGKDEDNCSLVYNGEYIPVKNIPIPKNDSIAHLVVYDSEGWEVANSNNIELKVSNMKTDFYFGNVMPVDFYFVESFVISDINFEVTDISFEHTNLDGGDKKEQKESLFYKYKNSRYIVDLGLRVNRNYDTLILKDEKGANHFYDISMNDLTDTYVRLSDLDEIEKQSLNYGGCTYEYFKRLLSEIENSGSVWNYFTVLCSDPEITHMSLNASFFSGVTTNLPDKINITPGVKSKFNIWFYGSYDSSGAGIFSPTVEITAFSGTKLYDTLGNIFLTKFQFVEVEVELRGNITTSWSMGYFR